MNGKRNLAKENAAKLEVIVPTIVTEKETMIEFFTPVHNCSSSNNLLYASVMKGSGIHCGGKENTPLLSFSEVEIIQSKGAIMTTAPINNTRNMIVFPIFDSLFIRNTLSNPIYNLSVCSCRTEAL